MKPLKENIEEKLKNEDYSDIQISDKLKSIKTYLIDCYFEAYRRKSDAEAELHNQRLNLADSASIDSINSQKKTRDQANSTLISIAEEFNHIFNEDINTYINLSEI